MEEIILKQLEELHRECQAAQKAALHVLAVLRGEK